MKKVKNLLTIMVDINKSFVAKLSAFVSVYVRERERERGEEKACVRE